MRRPLWSYDPATRGAWRAWTDGDIAECERRARSLPGRAREGLLFRCSYARQAYETALGHYSTLEAAGATATELDELAEPVVEAWLHLDRPDRAVEYLRRYVDRPGRSARSPVRNRNRRRERKAEQALAEITPRLTRPPTVRLDGTTELTFVDHELAPFLPAVTVTIDGVETRAHLDTGGTFVVMGPRRAAELGIRTTPGRPSHHGTARTQVDHGIIAELRLGAARLTNVPVEVLSTLLEQQDLVILGTNVLERFLATIDHPAGRLLLSPRRDVEAAESHARLLSGTSIVAELDFFLWSDHFMFARGGFGTRDDLNFFIDSGLVYVVPDERTGTPRQACLLTTARKYRSFGVDRRSVRRPHFHSAGPVSLGPLAQNDLLVATAPGRSAPWDSFGGVRIDGLLSHAFLSAYAWTLDFDRGRYVFRAPAGEAERQGRARLVARP